VLVLSFSFFVLLPASFQALPSHLTVYFVLPWLQLLDGNPNAEKD
jgi:hypothetical protein